MKKLCLVSLFFTFVCTLAAKEQFIYTQISRNEGLTSTVNSIFKEKDGDVWLGTPNGLYRFNGNTLHHYSDSLFSGRRIFYAGEDPKGNFWVLTNRWALMREEGEDRFCLISEESANRDYPIHSICPEEDGVWLGSGEKLFRYSYSDSSLSVFKELREKPGFLIRSIHKIDDDTLLCSSHNGLIYIDTHTGAVSDTPFDIFNEVSATLVDSRGRIWISFYNNGIAVYDKDGRLIRRYSTADSGLSNDVVLCMTERDSRIWAGTDGGGINIIDPSDGSIRTISYTAGDPSSFPAHSIKSIYTDDYGNIWAGSIRDGLIRISVSGMKTYTDSHIGLDTGLSNPTVLCLYQGNDSGHIWIGTDGGGINRFDPATASFTHYPGTLGTKVVSIAEYSKEELALSVYADGVYIFNKTTGGIRPLEIHDHDINYLLKYAGRSLNLANESDGSILLIGNTVSRLDRNTGRCTRIETEDGKKADGNFLIAGRTEEGLWIHDFYNLYLLPDDGPKIIRKGQNHKHLINSGHIGPDGRIWLATEEGLCRFNISDGTFSHVSTTLLNTATSVVCDSRSRVWVGTDNGLYAYLEESDSFTLFGESDGASANEYLSKPRLISREGDIFLGGVQGLLRIDKDYSTDTTDEPSFRLYSLTIDNQDTPVGPEGFCRLPRHSKSMEISVSTSEKDIFREKVYRFTIPGLGTVYEGKSPVLSLRPLPKAGKYDIFVTCTRRDGKWCEPYRLMTVRIPQPWYFSAWFIIFVVIAVAGIFTAVQISSVRRRNSRLQLAIKEQEQKVYEEKVQFLINISHELRTPLTLVMAPLKRILGTMNTENEHFPTLSRIYRQSRRMRDLINMVLDLRKMEVGKSRLRIESTPFNQWILNSTEDIINEEHADGIEIVTDLSPEVGMVDFDKTKCDTVLTNILMNAIKHSSKGDVITISTSLTAQGMVRTSVSDEGPGLRDIDPEKMFTRFYQSNSEQYGSGIGLSYSKILVELHGGRIGAENNEVKGATFWWEIPVRNAAEDLQTPARAYLNEIIGNNPADDITIPEGAAFSIAEKKIMLVDDNPDLLEFLREAMNADFGEIMTATGGEKAFRMISEGMLPDIIISDVNMPEGDGYTLCSRLKSDERYIHIPVILLTARGEEQSQGDVYKVGADAYMAKPFETETLVELIRNLLRRKENIRKRYFDNEGEAAVSYGSTEEGFILRLNAIIAEHLSDPELDQQLLCRELGVSRASLYNKMKAITGSGAKEYITRIRLEKAKSLIENSACTIAEISDMTGFASQSYFSTAFKNYTGMTPSQYKQECRK